MKQTEFWLSRDKSGGYDCGYDLWVGPNMPYKGKQSGTYMPLGPRQCYQMCNFTKERLAVIMPALRLKPGQCRKVVICEAELEGMDGMFIGFAKEKK